PPPRGWPIPAPAPREDSPPGISLLPPQQIAPVTGTPGEAGSLVLAVERLRANDPRFRAVRVEVQGGLVRLRGHVKRSEELMELAQAISRLAGVERVSVVDVRIGAER
ncbi:MAG: BON domain-containing protein, partial [Gemmataceae bacterium]|nr:BON domain-containing protein [Gemmataceae bacterium]